MNEYTPVTPGGKKEMPLTLIATQLIPEFLVRCPVKQGINLANYFSLISLIMFHRVYFCKGRWVFNIVAINGPLICFQVPCFSTDSSVPITFIGVTRS